MSVLQPFSITPPLEYTHAHTNTYSESVAEISLILIILRRNAALWWIQGRCSHFLCQLLVFQMVFLKWPGEDMLEHKPIAACISVLLLESTKWTMSLLFQLFVVLPQNRWKIRLEKESVARENNGNGVTRQPETEVEGRDGLEDVLPYKSACVWCTAINLNDLSPPRACFGIQEPQRGLLACQGCSSFGLPPLWNRCLLIRTCGLGESDCSNAITCPCPQGLTPWEPTHHPSGAKAKKIPSGSLTGNYCVTQLLRVHTYLQSAANWGVCSIR